MDQNQLASFIKNLNASPQSLEKVEKLLRHSAQAMDLLKKLQSAPASEKENVREAFLQTQREIVGEYEKMLAEMGLTRESLEEYASNPKNFSPENWAMLQSFKQQVSKEATTAFPKEKVEAPKKARKPKLAGKQDWLSA